MKILYKLKGFIVYFSCFMLIPGVLLAQESLPGSLTGKKPPPVKERIKDKSLIPNYVKDKSAAIKLGKALFWDRQAGSDGQACASCHFNAGMDIRIKNQLSPGLLGGNAVFDFTATGGDRSKLFHANRRLPVPPIIGSERPRFGRDF